MMVVFEGSLGLGGGGSVGGGEGGSVGVRTRSRSRLSGRRAVRVVLGGCGGQFSRRRGLKVFF